ncbi:MAG: response regulator [Gemmatimonadota bacterium]
MSPSSPGLDLFESIKIAVGGVADLVGHDASSAVLFWGHPPEVEVVYRNEMPEEVCRALSTSGGRVLADTVRRTGHPVRVRADALEDSARELRLALQENRIGALAVFPLTGEGGVVGCLIVPLDEGHLDGDHESGVWRIRCAVLRELQLLAGMAMLRSVMELQRATGIKGYDGFLVADRWERVIMAGGVFTEVAGWSREDPFGRALNTLPGGALVSSVPLGMTGKMSWEEHLLPPVEGHGVPVALAAIPFGLSEGASEGGRIILLRDLRPERSGLSDPNARLISLGMRVAHAADELMLLLVDEEGAVPGPFQTDPRSECDLPAASQGLDPMFLRRLRMRVQESQDLVREVFDLCLPAADRRQVDLNQVLGEILARYRPEMDAERIKVFQFQRPEIPPVEGDRIRIMGVFRFLLQAARRSLQGGGGTLTIRTWAEDGWVYGVVADDGLGYAGDGDTCTFEPLFAVDPGDSKDLSLAAVERTVADLGGKLMLETRPRLWTRLTVMLPQASEPTPGPASQVESHNAGAPSTTGGGEGDEEGLAILVVDDNGALRSVLRRVLERRGHSVTEATDGADALGIVTARSFDRVIVDLHMPVKDGPTFYEDLREIAPALRDRTIFMTGGFVQEGSEAFIVESGRPTIKKPFDLAEMVRTVEG